MLGSPHLEWSHATRAIGAAEPSPVTSPSEPARLPVPEAMLRDFFAGLVSPERLGAAVTGAVEPLDRNHRRVHVEDLPSGEDMVVRAPMLVRLCDAVLEGRLSAPALEIIAFLIVASEHLRVDPDDERVARVLFDWMSPEVNWQLTAGNIRMFREWLTGEMPLPPEPDMTTDSLSGLGILQRTSKVRSSPPDLNRR
jgi:hypothetical protein